MCDQPDSFRMITMIHRGVIHRVSNSSFTHVTHGNTITLPGYFDTQTPDQSETDICARKRTDSVPEFPSVIRAYER